jgi:hypothetical protein
MRARVERQGGRLPRGREPTCWTDRPLPLREATEPADAVRSSGSTRRATAKSQWLVAWSRAPRRRGHVFPSPFFPFIYLFIYFLKRTGSSSWLQAISGRGASGWFGTRASSPMSVSTCCSAERNRTSFVLPIGTAEHEGQACNRFVADQCPRFLDGPNNHDNSLMYGSKRWVYGSKICATKTNYTSKNNCICPFHPSSLYPRAELHAGQRGAWPPGCANFTRNEQ